MEKYVTNERLRTEIFESKKIGKASDGLIDLLERLVNTHVSKYEFDSEEDKVNSVPFITNYLIEHWERYNIDRKDRAFVYFRNMCQNGHKIYHHKLKKSKQIDDAET